jgi:hypothetical protein
MLEMLTRLSRRFSMARVIRSLMRAQVRHTRVRKELGGRRFGAEEAVGWAVSRQLLEPGQRAPRSQPETQARCVLMQSIARCGSPPGPRRL